MWTLRGPLSLSGTVWLGTHRAPGCRPKAREETVATLERPDLGGHASCLPSVGLGTGPNAPIAVGGGGRSGGLLFPGQACSCAPSSPERQPCRLAGPPHSVGGRPTSFHPCQGLTHRNQSEPARTSQNRLVGPDRAPTSKRTQASPREQVGECQTGGCRTPSQASVEPLCPRCLRQFENQAGPSAYLQN